MTIQTNVERARQVAQLLYDAWNSDGILGDRFMPEDMAPAGVLPGSPEHALFLTLTVAIDYMRDANQLWDAARTTFQDPQARYLFDPNQVVQTGPAKIRSDLTRYHLVKRPKRDSQIWTTICRTLNHHFQGRVEPLLEHADWNGPKIIALVRSSKYRSGFPYLKGPKIAPLWVRMLKDNWMGHPLQDMEKVELPVDIHTGAATLMAGCVTGDYRGDFREFAQAVQQVWREGCKDSSLYPLQLDEPLWHLSRNGCRKTSAMPCQFVAACPVAHLCTGTRLNAYGARGQLPNEVTFSTGHW